MLQRQNLPATKHFGRKSSGRQNVDIKKLMIDIKKFSPAHNKETLKKLNLFWRQEFLQQSVSITKSPAERIVLLKETQLYIVNSSPSTCDHEMFYL